MDVIPQFLDTFKKTKKQIQMDLKLRNMKSSFKLKEDAIQFVQDLKWPWKMPWRKDQKEVIDSFFQNQHDEIVVQAIFGGGKTTMMLAIIQYMVLQDPNLLSKIFICAFNIGIKNEIKKKLKKLGKFTVKTFDSLIYSCCKELNYKDLKLLNFETKRRFVRENLSDLVGNSDIQYVFIDETQDLEKSCYFILKHCFPNAKFMFVGDVFQSIQKEPRDSLLWFLLNRSSTPKTKVFKMMDTPRVPLPILSEMKKALLKFYPEFHQTIQNWCSTSPINSNTKIEWVQFKTYSNVYKEILARLKILDHKKTMILTFSSAITVRGSLGDVARFRKIFETQGISLNQNHKRMMDDRLFLSTVNSSKGLERDHVICILTFPLELAFANFSNDLVMNLITVALSRCKKDITFYVPIYDDRFSKVLDCFEKCPRPIQNDTKKAENKKLQPMKECNSFDYDPTDIIEMLQKEHSVTEILRQNILSFETRQLLLNYTYILEKYPLNNGIDNIPLNIRTEEESTFVGLIFESLILSLWSNHFPYCQFLDIQHHNVFSGHVEKIQNLVKHYRKFIKIHKNIKNEKIRFKGCFLYAQLHLFAYQKIFVHLDEKKSKVWYKKWLVLLPNIKKIPIHNCILQTQVNVSMPFLNGIIDAANMSKDKSKCMDIYEIKASKGSDWKQTALLQAIIYGILSAKALFHVYLVNVLSKNAIHYKIYFKKDLMSLRNKILQEILNWNINCFLAKNVDYKCDNIHESIPVHESIIMDGRYDHVNKKWIEFSVCEFSSATKTRLTILMNDSENSTIENDLHNLIQKYINIYKIKYIYGCPELCKNQEIKNKYNIIPIINQEFSVYQKNILKDEPDSLENNKLDFERSYNTLAFIICSLHKKIK